MRLHSVYARFYKSLNFDYIRASHENYVADPWDRTPDGDDYPFVRIKLKPDITTIVGGNESGKTQVLAAIEAALTGNGIERSDFCRYSRFFGTHKTLDFPEFGVLFTDITEDNVTLIRSMTGLRNLEGVDRIGVFRMNDTPKHRAYVRVGGEWSDATHIKTPTKLVEMGMPNPFQINADVPLPDSVPLEYLISRKPVAALGRELLRDVWDSIASHSSWFSSEAEIVSRAGDIHGAFRPLRDATKEETDTYKLAADLLLKVAGLKVEIFAELQTAVRSKSGYANSLVDTINEEIS